MVNKFNMSPLASTLLILGLVSALGVISVGLYYQFGREISSFTKLTKDDLTEEWTIQRCDSTFMPRITDINGQLIHVWFSDNGHTIHLESTSSDCQISLPSHKRVERPLQVVGSAIGNVVVALIEEDLTSRQKYFRIYSFHERYLCSVTIVKDIVISDEAAWNNSILLVAQHYTFDVFLKDDRYCGPGRICRRSYEGHTGTTVSLSNDTDLPVESDLWTMTPVKNNVPASGFIYAQKLPNDAISIRRLDFDLRTLARRRWSGIEYYSTTAGRISLCQKKNDRTLNCSLVDADLKDLLVDKTIDVPLDKDSRSVQLHNLPDGGVIVSWIGKSEHQVLYKRDTLVVRMRIVDAVGKVGDVIELLDHNVCEEYEIRSVEVIQGLCFRIGCHNGLSVKCIVPDKNRLFGWV